MRKLVTIFTVVLTAFAFATGVASAGGMKSAEVISADPAAKSIVLNVDGQEVTLPVADQAAAKLTDLKPGDKVQVSYEGEGAEQKVSTIEKQM
jgi:S1-C subfamily serine protease